MDDFEEMLAREMMDPAFKSEWDAIDPVFQITQAIIKWESESGCTKERLAEAAGISKGNISKLENGTANPSLRTLKRLAAGMGMKLRIEFLPM